MTGVEVDGRIRTFVTTALRAPGLKDSDDIFQVGGASSLFAAELVVFVEDELGILLDDEDLVRENFATIEAVGALARRKTSTSP